MSDEPRNMTTFASFLIEQRQGSLHSEASERLQELVRAVRETGKAGTLTLKIEIKQAENTINLIVSDDVTVKPPRAARGAAIFFADENGNLTRRDPYQTELPLREIGAKPKEIKSHE